MNKKFKIITSSVLGIVVSAGIAAGATYALFTSDATTNIAITSGKVNATAEIKDLQIFSANANLTSGEVVPDGDKLGVYSATYYYEDRTVYGTFIDGGTASLSNGNLTLDLIAPGDMVKAKFYVTNNSNVDVKYRLVAECTSTDDESLRLFSALRFTALGATKTGVKKYYTNWTLWTAADPVRTNSSDIKIEMPITLGNFYQDLNTNIKLSVEMVQANAFTTDGEDEILLFDNEEVKPGSTPSGMKDTVLTAGGTDVQPDFKVEIPTGTLNEVKAEGENVKVGDSLTLVVKTEPLSSSIVLADEEVAKNFEIHVVNQDDELITSVNTKIKVYVFIGEDKEILRVYHKNVLVTDYDYQNGYVIYETADFSPFTVILFDPNIEATIGDVGYSTLAAAIADAENGDTVLLHRNVISTEQYLVNLSNSTIIIDLGGHKVTVTNSTESTADFAGFIFNDSSSGKANYTLKNGAVEAIDGCKTGIYAVNCVFTAQDLTVSNAAQGYFGLELRCNKSIVRNVATTSYVGGGFYANGGKIEMFDCTATQTGFYNHTSTGLAAANGGVMTCHDVTVTSENYGAFVFSSGGTINLYRGEVTATGTKEALLAGISDWKDSKISVVGTTVKGAIAQGSENASLYVYEGKFNVNPSSFVQTGSTVTGPVEGIYTVSVAEDKTVLVYDDTYNHNAILVNKIDVSANDKLIGGDYVLSSSEAEALVEDGYTYVGSWSYGFICKTKGSTKSSGSVVSMSFTRNSNSYTLYYSSFEDCFEEAPNYDVTSLTLRANVTVEGNFTCPYILNGTSYTLTVTGTIPGGTFGCKVKANAITGGTFNSTTAVVVADGGITGGSFKALPAASAIAAGKNVAFENNMFVIVDDISSYNAYYVSNGVNVYGNFDTIYSKGNITLLDDVTTTYANAVNYFITLNGHSFTLDNASYTAVMSKDSTKVLIVANALVSEGKLNLGSYRKNGADLTDYPLVTGTSVAVGTSNYIVRTADLNGDGLMYKGIYTFDKAGIFAEGYDDYGVKDSEGTLAYITGKNVQLIGNKIVAGVFCDDPTPYILTGKVLISEVGGTWTVTPDESKAVAKIGDVKYITVGQAMSAVTSGGTVTLIADDTVDTSVSYSKSNIILDLNGHTLTAADTVTELIVTGYSASNITLKNGSVVCSGFLGNSSNSSTLTVIDVNVTCTTLFTRYYKALSVVSGTFSVEVAAKYVASGSSVEKVGEVWVVTKNA